MTSPKLLHTNHHPTTVRKVIDPLAVKPAVIAPNRGFKQNRAAQEPMADNPGGAAACLFCAKKLLRKHPIYLQRGRVLAFPNDFPFLEGDHMVYCLWHPDIRKRQALAHRFRLADFGAAEFYYLSMAAIERASAFPNTRDGHAMLGSIDPIRPGRYLSLGIQNLNITYSGSPLAHHWYPIMIDLIPKLSTPGFYESMGCNVVDGTPEDAVGFFRGEKPWTEIMNDAHGLKVSKLYPRYSGKKAGKYT
ncbi:MAG: hypothetical protein ACRESZ_07715 [Methylococcales bacterium]